VLNSHNLKVQDGGRRHLEFRENVNNSGMDETICTKFGGMMRHRHAEMTTWSCLLQAVINEDSLMRRRLCNKLHGRPSQLLAHPAVIDRFVQNRDLCLHHLHSTPPLEGAGLRRNRPDISMTSGMEKLEWFGYPVGKFFLKICLFVSTEFTNVGDKRTDGQTPHDVMGRACIASRGKTLGLRIFFMTDDAYNAKRIFIAGNSVAPHIKMWHVGM